MPINAWIASGDKDFSSRCPASAVFLNCSAIHQVNRVNASCSNFATGSTSNAPTDEAAQVAGFNWLFGTAYSQEVDGEPGHSNPKTAEKRN